MIRLSDGIAVKHGLAFACQARTQEFAYRHLDPSVVRVPRIYRYFQRPRLTDQSLSEGYIFMEFGHGKTLEEADLNDDYDHITNGLAKIVSHFHLIQEMNGTPTGPVGGGTAHGYLLGEYGAMNFKSIEQLDGYLNKRLKIIDKSIDQSAYALVLCHMDLGRRNRILILDGSTCIVDWAYARLYPLVLRNGYADISL